MNNLEKEVNDEVLKDKIDSFYNKYKIYIKIFFLILIIIPLFLQFYFYYKKKIDEDLLSKLLQAELILDRDQTKAINILNDLRTKDNQTIIILSTNVLIEHYLKNNKINDAINLINNSKMNLRQSYLNELLNIKKVILNFDELKEQEILNLLKRKESDVFYLIKNKLLYDFYIKNNQFNKAKQIKNINE